MHVCAMKAEGSRKKSTRKGCDESSTWLLEVETLLNFLCDASGILCPCEVHVLWPQRNLELWMISTGEMLMVSGVGADMLSFCFVHIEGQVVGGTTVSELFHFPSEQDLVIPTDQTHHGCVISKVDDVV